MIAARISAEPGWRALVMRRKEDRVLIAVVAITGWGLDVNNSKPSATLSLMGMGSFFEMFGVKSANGPAWRPLFGGDAIVAEEWRVVWIFNPEERVSSEDAVEFFQQQLEAWDTAISGGRSRGG